MDIHELGNVGLEAVLLPVTVGKQSLVIITIDLEKGLYYNHHQPL